MRCRYKSAVDWRVNKVWVLESRPESFKEWLVVERCVISLIELDVERYIEKYREGGGLGVLVEEEKY